MVPADHKHVAWVVVSAAIVEALEELKPEYPKIEGQAARSRRRSGGRTVARSRCRRRALRNTCPGGALAGFGGATITVGYLGSFSDDVTSGRGYVAIAVVIIGRWSPVGAMLGALLFALFDSLALLAQNSSVGLPVEFFQLPLPGNGDLGSKRLGSNACFSDPEDEHFRSVLEGGNLPVILGRCGRGGDCPRSDASREFDRCRSRSAVRSR
jgi:Branched-chain amino acid transport system / permease component